MSLTNQEQKLVTKVQSQLLKADKAIAEQRWDDARDYYFNASASLKGLGTSAKEEPIVTWLLFQSELGQAYALTEQAKSEPDVDIAEASVYLSQAKAYDQSNAYIAAQLETHETLRTRYGVLLAQYDVDIEPPLPAVVHWRELDDERAFGPLLAALETQCLLEGKNQTPVFLAIYYKLERLTRYLLTNARKFNIDIMHQDKDDHTLLSFAKAHGSPADIASIAAMEEQLQQALQKQAKRKARFKKNKASWRETPVPLSENYQKQELWLDNQLRSLLEPHAFDEANLNISQAIKTIAGFMDINLLAEAQMLTKKLLPPDRLVMQPVPTPASTRWVRRILNKPKPTTAERRFTAEPLQQLLTEIAVFRAKLTQPIYQPFNDALGQLVACYQNFLAAPSLEARATFYSQNADPRHAIGRRYIKREHMGCFFPQPEQDGVELAERSTHRVHEAHGMHFKLDASFPGVEFMTHSLNMLVSGIGSPPTRLVKVFYQQEENLYLISKTVSGEDLDYILKNHPEYLDKLDMTNFSYMFFSSLLTDPQDGKGDNYKVQFEYDATTRELKRVKIIGIDNDLNFAVPILQNDNGHVLDIKCILYALPAMKAPIDGAAKKRFLELNPATLVVQWLQRLQAQNLYYAKLHQEGVLTATDLANCQLPIKLYPGTAETIYHKIVSIQAKLREDDDNQLREDGDKHRITHNDILEALQPMVYHTYRALLKRHNDSPLGVIEALYVADKLENREDRWVLEDLLNVKEKLTPDETIEMYLARQQAARGDFELKRTQSLEDALHDFVANHSGRAIDKADEIALINQLGRSPVPITKLTLQTSTRVQADEMAEALLAPLTKGDFATTPLQTLHLRACGSLEHDGIETKACQHGVQVVHETQVLPVPAITPTTPADAREKGVKKTVPTRRKRRQMMAASPASSSSQTGASVGQIRSAIATTASSSSATISLHWYTDEHIKSYLDVAMTEGDLRGHQQDTYRVHTTHPEDVMVDTVDGKAYHLFVLPALDTLSAAYREPLGQQGTLSSLPLVYAIDKTTRDPSELMRLIEAACQQDSREALEQLLNEAEARGDRHEGLHDLLRTHATWTDLKPALQVRALQEQQAQGVDLVDELLACMTMPESRAKVMFAYNQGQVHWLVGELKIIKTANHVNIEAYTHDPYGGGEMSATVAQTLEQALRRRLQQHDPAITLTFSRLPSLYGPRQHDKDRVSCGVIVADDIHKRLLGQSLYMKAPHSYGAPALRQSQREKIAQVQPQTSGESPSKVLTIDVSHLSTQEVCDTIWTTIQLLPQALYQDLLVVLQDRQAYRHQDDSYTKQLEVFLQAYPLKLAQQHQTLHEETLFLLAQLTTACCHPKGLLKGDAKVLYPYTIRKIRQDKGIDVLDDLNAGDGFHPRLPQSGVSLDVTSSDDEYESTDSDECPSSNQWPGMSKPIDIPRRRGQNPEESSPLLISLFSMSDPPASRLKSTGLVDRGSPRIESYTTRTTSKTKKAEDPRHILAGKGSPPWLQSSSLRRTLSNNVRGQRSSYQVANEAYEMAVYAIKASSAGKHYLPFIDLLVNSHFAPTPGESIEAKFIREERIRGQILGDSSGDDGNEIIKIRENKPPVLEGIPLYCRQHFDADNAERVIEQLIALAGSAPVATKDAEYGNNLAHVAALFSARFILPWDGALPELCKPTMEIYRYFRKQYPALLLQKNMVGYTPGDMWLLLHAATLPDESFMERVSNANLRLFHIKMVNLWRFIHYYLVDWQMRQNRLTEIEEMHFFFRVVGWLFLVPERLSKGLIERETFRAREETALRALQVVNAAMMLPMPHYIEQLNELRDELERHGFIGRFANGSALRKIITTFVTSLAGSELHQLVTSSTMLQAVEQQVERYLSLVEMQEQQLIRNQRKLQDSERKNEVVEAKLVKKDEAFMKQAKELEAERGARKRMEEELREYREKQRKEAQQERMRIQATVVSRARLSMTAGLLFTQANRKPQGYPIMRQGASMSAVVEPSTSTATSSGQSPAVSTSTQPVELQTPIDVEISSSVSRTQVQISTVAGLLFVPATSRLSSDRCASALPVVGPLI